MRKEKNKHILFLIDFLKQTSYEKITKNNNSNNVQLAVTVLSHTNIHTVAR